MLRRNIGKVGSARSHRKSREGDQRKRNEGRGTSRSGIAHDAMEARIRQWQEPAVDRRGPGIDIGDEVSLWL